MTKRNTNPGTRLAYWGDDSVPDLAADLRGSAIDPADFVLWLGTQLEEYRFTRQALDDMPNRKAEVNWLDKVDKHMTELETMLKHGSARATPSLYAAASRRGRDWGDLESGLGEIRAIIKDAASKLPAENGNPGTLQRDRLIAAVYAEIQRRDPMKVEAARGYARAILKTARVHKMPDSDDGIEAAILRGTKPVGNFDGFPPPSIAGPG
jgi:hypothetical protein